MGKIVVGDNQNILLTSGQVIKSKHLTVGDSVIGFDKEKKKVSYNRVTNIDKSNEPVILFSSAHGRIILCSNKTKFYGRDHSITSFENNDFDNYSRKNYVKCLTNYPVFGTKDLDNKDIESLRSSIFYLNDKRPNNRKSLVQTIPKLLSTLTKDSLKKVLDDVDLVRNLDIYSKDLLLMLVCRLGYWFNGKSHGRRSDEISGSFEIIYSCKGCVIQPPRTLRTEKLTPLGDSDMDSTTLTFESPAVFIGSLLCQTT